MKTMFRLSLAIAALALATPALAQTATGSFDVTATVVKACRVQNAITLAFGNYEAFADLDNGTTFDIRCNPNTAYSIEIGDGGASYGAGLLADARAMDDGLGNYLSYYLYSDASGGTRWDPGTAVTGTTPTGAAVSIPVYGRVPLDQFIALGNYSDLTVSITVTY